MTRLLVENLLSGLAHCPEDFRLEDVRWEPVGELGGGGGGGVDEVVALMARRPGCPR